MNIFFYLIITTASILFSADAFAKGSSFKEDFYLRANIGESQSRPTLKKSLNRTKKFTFIRGVNSALGVGYKFCNNVRSEVVYSRIDNLRYSTTTNSKTVGPSTVWKQKLRLQSVMINAYYDVDLKSKFSPYIGAGLGYTYINPTNISAVAGQHTRYYLTRNSQNFSYSLMAGFAINLTKELNLDIFYKFQDFGKMKRENEVVVLGPPIALNTFDPQSKILIHSILMSLRYDL